MISNHIWLQTEITLPKAHRGFHIITKDIDDAFRSLDSISVGILNTVSYTHLRAHET